MLTPPKHRHALIEMWFTFEKAEDYYSVTGLIQRIPSRFYSSRPIGNISDLNNPFWNSKKIHGSVQSSETHKHFHQQKMSICKSLDLLDRDNFDSHYFLFGINVQYSKSYGIHIQFIETNIEEELLKLYERFTVPEIQHELQLQWNHSRFWYSPCKPWLDSF